MAPAVPFALLGVVQLTAVAVWLGLAGAAAFPRLRRRVTPAFVVGALALAAADALTAVRFGSTTSDPVGWLRVAGLGLLAVGATGGCGQSLVTAAGTGLGGVVVPLGARPTPAIAGGLAGLLGAIGAWWRGRREGADPWFAATLGGGLLLTGVAAVLAAPARHSDNFALAQISTRAIATALLFAAVALLSRELLLGKIVGAILAGVVAMAAGAVGVVGTGVADEVQGQQSQRLLQVAQSEQAGLATLATRATLFAQVVAQACHPHKPANCANFLQLFSDQPDYFGALVTRKGALVVAPNKNALSAAALLQLEGSRVVGSVLARGATPQTVATGALLLSASPPKLVIVAAVPGGRTDPRVKPGFAAVYGVGLVDAYLAARANSLHYDVTVIADGRVLASSLKGAARDVVLREATAAGIENADPSVHRVVPAQGTDPTVAFVPVTAAGNDDVRLATLALSQPANEALAAQQSVLRRLFLTALIALGVVTLLALALAQRITEPVRRLTLAAGRIRRGDLEATTSIASRDEVGRLSRAFDAMTESLRQATSDLRDTAATEAELRARLETVVASMNDGLVVVDADSVITTANPTAARLLGVSAEDIVGRALSDVVRVEDAEGRSLLGRAARRTVEGDLVRGDGNRLPVRFGSAPLADGQGRVLLLADRTREHEVERMKTEFLANISHELRTPLTPIRGYAEMIARRPELSRKQVESFVDEILSSTSRMSRAVELLVDVAALDGGRVEPHYTKVSLRSFVDDRLAQWKVSYPDRADDFKRRLAAKLPAVEIDRQWVGRALDEFADNAVKYTSAGSKITVVASADEDGGGVWLAVRDTGPGFDPQRAAELVGDFSQADASETRRVGGLGLGLGFVSRVAERFGLPLSVETEPGAGSTFALLLPAADGR